MTIGGHSSFSDAKINQEYRLNKESAYKFHQTMLSMRGWLYQEMEQKHNQKQKENENRHKDNKASDRDDFGLVANNMMAEASHLSPVEFAIFSLSDVKYNKDTRKVNVHFALPSKFRFEPYIHDFMNETMDKIEKIWGNTLKEIEEQYRVKHRKKE